MPWEQRFSWENTVNLGLKKSKEAPSQFQSCLKYSQQYNEYGSMQAAQKGHPLGQLVVTCNVIIANQTTHLRL